MTDQQLVTPVGVSVEHLTQLYLLESLKGFGPQKFKEVYNSQVSLRDVLNNPSLLTIRGKTGDTFRELLRLIDKKKYDAFILKAQKQIEIALRRGAKIITYGHPAYPKNVFDSNNPIPILYVQGSLEVLSKRKVVACVGSRKIRPPYSLFHESFSNVAISQGFSIASGFALGADTIGHETAFNNGGQTICVMPSGLDRPFPPENRDLWNRLSEYENAIFVTEFPFGTRTSSLTLRKRNKLIVAFSIGVLIAQSSAKGGAMNAYRFAREQRKPVATFAPDKSEDTSGNELICRESRENDALFAQDCQIGNFQEWLRKLSYLT